MKILNFILDMFDVRPRCTYCNYKAKNVHGLAVHQGKCESKKQTVKNFR